MSLMLIFVGMLFFLNPMISVIDILPDFLGCILILLGINKIGVIAPEFNESRKYFKWMIYSSIGRTLVLFMGGGAQDVLMVSLTMVFAFADFFIMYGALGTFYEGIQQLNIKHGGKSSETSEFKYIGIIFFAVRGFFSVLPLLGALGIGDDSDFFVSGPDYGMWEEYSGLLMGVNVVITLIAGAFWLVTIIRVLAPLVRDMNFNTLIEQEYSHRRRTDPDFFTVRSLLFIFAVFMNGGFFLIDFIADGINYIPDAVFGLVTLWAVYMVRRFSNHFKNAFITGGIYVVISAVSLIYSNVFMKENFYAPYEYVMANHQTEYFLMFSFAILESVALVVYLWYLTKIISDICKDHTVIDVPVEFKRTAQRNEESMVVTNRLNSAYFGVGSVTAVSAVVLRVCMFVFPEYWMIHLVMNVAFFCVSNMLFGKLALRVRERYNRDDV